MKTLIIITLAVLTMLTSHARIGETVAECTKRYGDPRLAAGMKPGDLLFVKGQIGIIVSFHNGKCDYIFYRKIGEEVDGIDLPKELTENEIEFILKLNGGGKPWTITEEEPMGTLWENKELKLLSYYHKGNRILSICTEEAHLRSDKERKEKEVKALDGL